MCSPEERETELRCIKSQTNMNQRRYSCFCRLLLQDTSSLRRVQQPWQQVGMLPEAWNPPHAGCPGNKVVL